MSHLSKRGFSPHTSAMHGASLGVGACDPVIRDRGLQFAQPLPYTHFIQATGITGS